MPLSASKLKHCRVCHKEFMPFSSTQKVCSQQCAYQFAVSNRVERQKAQWRKDAVAFRKREAERKVGLSRKATTGPLRAAEMAVNAYILIRDENKPCIVHGWHCEDTEFHAGHYKSKGAHPERRFQTLNIHKQCATSNSGAHNRKRYKNGIAKMYELGLVERYGTDLVARLNGPSEIKQYKADDLKRIADIFRRKAKLYKRLRGQGNVRSNDGADAHAKT